MRVGPCPGCTGVVSFRLEMTGRTVKITAGHAPPSCDWYKAFPDSISVAKAVGLVPNDVPSVRADN